MTNQIEILKQMFESLSDNQKADFLTIYNLKPLRFQFTI